MVAASAGPGAGEVDNGSDLRRLVTPPYPSTTTPLIPLQLIDPSPEAFDQEFKSFAWKCKTSLVFVSRCRSIGWIEVSRTPLSHHPGFVPQPARWHLHVCAIDGPRMVGCHRFQPRSRIMRGFPLGSTMVHHRTAPCTLSHAAACCGVT